MKRIFVPTRYWDPWAPVVEIDEGVTFGDFVKTLIRWDRVCFHDIEAEFEMVRNAHGAVPLLSEPDIAGGLRSIYGEAALTLDLGLVTSSGSKVVVKAMARRWPTERPENDQREIEGFGEFFSMVERNGTA